MSNILDSRNAVSLAPGFNPVLDEMDGKATVSTVSLDDVAQTAKSAASRVFQPAKAAIPDAPPVWKSATQPAGKRAPGSRLVSIPLAALAAALLLASLKLPLWHMHLEAPQYRDEEALNIAVHPNSFHGDLRELAVLDQYIGVHIPPTLPQFQWLPLALIAAAALGIVASALPGRFRSRALVPVSIALTAALAVAAIQAVAQMHEIGHRRDQKTILVGVKDFTPPFLGTAKIAQFEVTSRFGLGAWLIGGALALQLGAAWAGRMRGGRNGEALNSKAETSLLASAATP